MSESSVSQVAPATAEQSDQAAAVKEGRKRKADMMAEPVVDMLPASPSDVSASAPESQAETVHDGTGDTHAVPLQPGLVASLSSAGLKHRSEALTAPVIEALLGNVNMPAPESYVHEAFGTSGGSHAERSQQQEAEAVMYPVKQEPVSAQEVSAATASDTSGMLHTGCLEQAR